jgi:hypothetical protein
MCQREARTDEDRSNVDWGINMGAGAMTYAAHRAEFSNYADHKPAPEHGAANGAGLLRRVFDAVFESRQRHADKEIARFIANSGGSLTDDIERRMMARLTTSDWRVRERGE